MTLENCKYTHKVIQPYSWIKIMSKHDVIMWLWWVNDNICDMIKSDTEKTTMVKLRIATGMLNKVESLTDLEKIQIHMNLTRNVNNEIIRLRCDGLPF